jgi:hypothetical protein
MTEERESRGRLKFEEPTPFPPEQLATMRKQHRPDGDYENPGCAECYRLWPCQTSRLMVMIPDDGQVVVSEEYLDTITDPDGQPVH